MILDLREGLRVAWGGIWANKVRAGLTMLGVLIGVATVVALLSIGAGASASISARISSAGTDLILVSPGATRGFGGVQTAGGGAQSLTLADAQAIADPDQVPDALLVVPEFGANAQVIHGDANVNAQVKGSTPDYPAAYGLSLASGRFLDARDLAGRRNVAVLGSEVAGELFGGLDPLGQRIKVYLRGEVEGLVILSVVGVLAVQQRSALGGNPDGTIFVPLGTAQYELFGGRNVYGQAIVNTVSVVAAAGRSEVAAAEIDALLRQRHAIADTADADFRVTNQEDLLAVAGEVSQTLTLFLGVIAVISLIVGGIGIMNIMLVSVTERTREIGIRKAVGARTSDILLQFMLEAIALSLVGGLLGVAVGAAVTWGITAFGLMTARLVPSSVVLAMSFSLAVGLLSGIYPARRAAGLRPIEALRYE